MFVLRLVRASAFLCLMMFVTACGASHTGHEAYSSSSHYARPLPAPHIIASANPSQCVPHARKVSNIQIRGDAWTWWTSAKGTYARTDRPQIGSVMVLSKSDRLRYGHLAVVTHVVNEREILVEHANWLNRGQVHKHQRVVDVSRKGDWSAVKLWYTPGHTMGVTIYPVSGFVLGPKSSGPRSVHS